MNGKSFTLFIEGSFLLVIIYQDVVMLLAQYTFFAYVKGMGRIHLYVWYIKAAAVMLQIYEMLYCNFF